VQLHLAQLPAYVRAMGRASALLNTHPRWIALIAGAVSATGFAPLGLWPLLLLGLALLISLIASANTAKRAFALGWFFGAGQFSIGLNWLAISFTHQAAMPAWLGWIAVLVLSMLLALFPAFAAMATWRMASKPSLVMGRGPSLPFILALAGCWITAEWLRSWIFTGFAWNPLSAAFVVAGGIATGIGTYGASGVVILAVGALALLVHRKWLSAAACALLPLYSALLSFAQIPGPDDRPNKIAVTVVQPNISQIDKNSAGYDVINFRRLAENTLAVSKKPRLIFWPESATPWKLEDGYPLRFYQFQPGENAQGARATLARLMNPGDILLTGADRLEFDTEGQLIGARNSASVVDSNSQILGQYDKAHLVPYGEYLALRWLLEPLGASRLVPGDLDFWPGPGPRTLQLPFEGRQIKVGIQICYEIVFSGQVVDRTNRPDFIFNPSNDAWYGTWGPPQHLAQTRLRALEEGLPVVRSTPTGISAIIDADGRIVESLPLGKAGRIDGFLPQAKAPTLFASYGNILPLSFAALLIALSLSMALLPLARRRASR
jgi:apolipoprotein N-acyltransferase